MTNMPAWLCLYGPENEHGVLPIIAAHHVTREFMDAWPVHSLELFNYMLQVVDQSNSFALIHSYVCSRCNLAMMVMDATVFNMDCPACLKEDVVGTMKVCG
jgi:hypothetical protein